MACPLNHPEEWKARESANTQQIKKGEMSHTEGEKDMGGVIPIREEKRKTTDEKRESRHTFGQKDFRYLSYIWF